MHAMIHANEASWDRALRIVVGATMILLGWTGAVGGPAGIALELFGWVPFVTGVAGWDPFYALLDYSTKHGRRRPS